MKARSTPVGFHVLSTPCINNLKYVLSFIINHVRLAPVQVYSFVINDVHQSESTNDVMWFGNKPCTMEKHPQYEQ